MQRSGIAVILSVSFGLSLLPAQAKKRPDDGTNIQMPDVHIQSPKVTPAAEEALNALGKMFDTRDGLKDCHVEFRSVTDAIDDSGHMSPYTITASGDLQKPTRMNLRLSHGKEFLGQLVNDGVTVTFYNAKTNTYAQYPAPATYDIESSLSDEAEKKLKAVETSVKTGKEPPISKPSPQEQAETDAVGVFGEYGNPPQPFVMNGAAFLLRKSTKGEAEPIFMLMGDVEHTKAALTGFEHPAEMVDLSLKTTSSYMISNKKEHGWSKTQMHFAFDSVSKLPIEFRLGMTSTMFSGVAASTITTFNYKYDKIVLASTPYPTSTFTWVAPANAKVYQKPKETDPFANLPK